MPLHCGRWPSHQLLNTYKCSSILKRLQIYWASELPKPFITDFCFPYWLVITSVHAFILLPTFYSPHLHTTLASTYVLQETCSNALFCCSFVQCSLSCNSLPCTSFLKKTPQKTFHTEKQNFHFFHQQGIAFVLFSELNADFVTVIFMLNCISSHWNCPITILCCTQGSGCRPWNLHVPDGVAIYTKEQPF